MLFGVAGQDGESATHWDSLSHCASAVVTWPVTVRGAKVLKRRVIGKANLGLRLCGVCLISAFQTNRRSSLQLQEQILSF